MNALYRILMAIVLLQQINAQTYPSHVMNSNQINSQRKLTHLIEKAEFKIPYTGAKSPSLVYLATIFICGKNMQGEISGTLQNTYIDEYTPGPYYDPNTTPAVNDKINFNTVWTVYKFEIENHIKDFMDNGIINFKSDNIYKWPGKNNPYFESYNHFKIAKEDYVLAPFYDQNRDGDYNPDDGDYPLVEPTTMKNLPDEINFCIFHKSIELKMEFALTTYAFHCSSNAILDRSIFYSCRVTHKDASFGDFSDCKFSIFIDYDLGCYVDDYLGCIPDQHALFWYNNDNLDGNDTGSCDQGVTTYGVNPPAGSLTLLNQKLDVCRPRLSGEIGPLYPREYYYYLSNKLFNPISTQFTLLAFPDNPNNPNGWSMYTMQTQASDDIAFIATNQGNFKFNESRTIDFAISYHRQADSNHLQNVNLAFKEIPQLHDIYNNNFSLNCNNIQCNNDCIWSGDTDNDGIVDHEDAINIFKNYNATGSTRSNPYIWQGGTANDWSNINMQTNNPKFADANGDGKIDSADLAVIKIFYKNIHNIYKPKPQDCSEGIDLILRFDSSSVRSSLKKFYLEYNHNISHIMGLSFELFYDANIFYGYTLNPRSFWKESTLQFYGFQNEIIEINKSSSHYTWFTKTHHNEEINRISFFRFPFISKNLPPPTKTELYLCNAKAYLEDGTIIPLHSNRLVLDLSTITGTEIHVDDELDILPNPAHDIITISGLTLKYIMNIYNSNGRLMSSHTINNSSQNISVANLNSGIYILELKNSKHTIIKKLVISK